MKVRVTVNKDGQSIREIVALEGGTKGLEARLMGIKERVIERGKESGKLDMVELLADILESLSQEDLLVVAGQFVKNRFTHSSSMAELPQRVMRADAD